MKLNAKLFVLMTVLFFIVTSILWFYSVSFIQSINEEWVQKFVKKQIVFDKHRTLLPILRELDVVREMAKNHDIVAMAHNDTNLEVRQKGINALEYYRNKFIDRSYFAAFESSKHYYFNDSLGHYENNQLRYTLSSLNPDDSWFFYTLSQKDNYIINVNKDTELGITKVWINYILKEGNRRIGIVGTGFDFDTFLKESVGLEQEGVRNFFINKDLAIQLARDSQLIDYASMTKSDGQHKTIDLFLPEAKDREAVKKAMQDIIISPDRVQTLWVNFEGKKQLLGIVYLPEIGWFSLTLINPTELTLLNSSSLFLILSAVFLSILFIVGMASNIFFIYPLNQLKQMMRRVEHGEYNIHPTLVGSGEIRELSEQFKHMVEYVHSTNLALEEKVQERTKGLLDSEQKLQQLLEKVQELAFYDALTHLPNRRMLEDRLNVELAKVKRTQKIGGLMFLDLDNFKPLNDAFGHNAGDCLLVEVAQRLLSVVREGDTAARFGGDEFIVLLSDIGNDVSTAHEKMQHVADKILEALSAPYTIDVHYENGYNEILTHYCSVSIGLTLFNKHDTEKDKILQRADRAMYQAKTNGRNRIEIGELEA
ncbi:MAG: diguanylate cyclase [Sulfurospirillaceae bacterium]|nr:diguanylate cyclase [Sulfurospirillaceae bacterium]MDD2827731.1 diguanylate cyclase [Sulfurospirillaceae bacterium]